MTHQGTIVGDERDTMIEYVDFGQSRSNPDQTCSEYEKGPETRTWTPTTWYQALRDRSPDAQFLSFYVMAHPVLLLGSGLRRDPAARCGFTRPHGGGPAASRGKGPRGHAVERRPGASAVFSVTAWRTA